MTRDEIINKSKYEGGMFVVIPSVVQLDAELPLSAKMLYGIITWKCNSYALTWATNRELGEALGVSAKRVSALLALLEQRGHIETEIEYRDGTREILCRRIFPIMKSARSLAKDTPPPKNEDTPPSERGHLPSGMSIPLPENAEVICNINNNKKNTPYSPPAGDAPAPGESKPKGTRSEKSMPVHDPDAFEKLWEIYPRKDSRKATIRAWDKLKPDRALCRVMYIAIKRQRRSEQWNEANGKCSQWRTLQPIEQHGGHSTAHGQRGPKSALRCAINNPSAICPIYCIIIPVRFSYISVGRCYIDLTFPDLV